MSLPPDDVDPADLFLKLTKRRPSEVWPFPRLSDDGEPMFETRIFVLSDNELVEAKMAARKWAAERLKDASGVLAEFDKDLLGDRTAKEILVRSVHQNRTISGGDPDDPRYRRLFAKVEDIGELTADEWSTLYGQYIWTQRRFGPVDATFDSEAEVNAWVARLEEAGRNGFLLLSLLQSHQRDALVLSLVSRASSALKALQGCPPENLHPSLASLLETWLDGTGSSSTPVAESGSSPAEETISAERALDAAKAAALMRSASRGI